MTVFDAGAYAGEALFETMKAGDKRLIGYAVDYGTRVEQDSDSGNQSVREVHVRNGNIEIRYAQHETRTYSATNVDSKPKTLIIEQENGSYSLISPKPIEKTAKADRFELKLPANGSGKLTVEQEEVTSQTYVVANSTPDFLVSIVSNRQLSPAARTGLQSIADLKSRLAETNSALSSSKSALDDLTADQTRLRANIDSLNRVKGQEDQVRKYSGQLSDNEAQIAKLRDQRRDLELTQAKLNGQLRDEIQKLDF